ncbi:AEC family transporter [Motilimonas cestriensis]|uniref:AEC family transporter n=1 Tax=Motilimonas cestriensis TaxID=2742685 RepID=A0ABS8W7B3_9GAMM|nr:AEC family transporter [Motilimonas cestriensis]MCE2593704.1 AEC family transporter [Motilimonas cestriensis]
MLSQVIAILLPVFSLVLVGFWVGKTMNINFAPINRLNIDVFVPALVFSSLVAMPLNMSQGPLIIAALSVLLLPGVLFICLAPKSMNFKSWAPTLMFRNSGNLAIPLFGYAFGAVAAEAAVLLFVVSTCLHVIFGSLILSNQRGWQNLVSAFKTPLFIAALAAITLNLGQVHIYQPIAEATQLLGQAAIPVMLLALGSQMTQLQLDGLKTGLINIALSLLTGAVSFTLVYLFIPLPSLHLKMILLFSMLPPAVMNYLYAERYQNEPHKVAAMVLFGNASALISLPILLFISLSL